jgi:AcrR family transcriptional regulator
MTVSERREVLKARLIAAAERTVAARGLGSLRARDLAREAGCAVGAIYNVFADLDALILAVNVRTLVALERELRAASEGDAAEAGDPPARLVRLALAYLDYARANTHCWRAVFEHRMAPGRALPQWYLDAQQPLFGYVEAPLRGLQPEVSPDRLALLARSLVSAVHGMVMLGLEEKLQALPAETLREQLAFVVTAAARGLSATVPTPRLTRSKRDR